MIVSNFGISCGKDINPWCSSGSIDNVKGTASDSTLTPTGHLVVAVFLGFIGTFGFFNNLIVLILFCRYKMLRSPINCLLVSISVSDLAVSVLGTPFSFAASIKGRWLIGPAGCVWYGFVNACFGIVSLISLAVLSYERYCTMIGQVQADHTNYKKVGTGIAFSWGYSIAWTVPPLFGWSRYGPEGPGTTCSVDWATKTANNISYILCLFIFCLVVPFLVIVFSYGKLLRGIKQVSRIKSAISRKREQRVLLMVIIMVVCFLLCWLPYGITALLATFGRPGLVTPEASIIPSVLAKSSTAINPVIYIFMNKQFNRCFCALLKCKIPEKGSSIKTTTRATKPFRTVRHDNGHDVPTAVVSAGQATTFVPESSFRPAVSLGARSSANPRPAVDRPMVSLVAHYNG